MPRKLRLTPYQGDLLLTLEEAGAEYIQYIVNLHQTDAIEELEEEVMPLLRIGLVKLFRNWGQPGFHYMPLSREEVEALPPFVEMFSKGTDSWGFHGIMLTDAGYTALRE